MQQLSVQIQTMHGMTNILFPSAVPFACAQIGAITLVTHTGISISSYDFTHQHNLYHISLSNTGAKVLTQHGL